VPGSVELVRPPVLRSGDLVMLVSPSSPARRERIDAGIEILSGWGLKAVFAPGALDREGFFAGSDAARLAGINAALRDPDVRGVICTRGGYGAQRIVDGLDIDAVRADPKVLAGFSDITALQLALWQRAGLASVHSPMMAWNAERTGGVSAESMRSALMSTDPVVLAARPDEETSPLRIDGPIAHGRLLGGNLCLLAATIGTPDMPDLSGAILLLEDVDEAPYKVDRMLTHLHRCGALAGIAGVAVGQFTGCADGWATSIVDVLGERLGNLGVPVLGGLPIGHGRDQLSTPVGVPAALNVAAGTLTVEPAVA
jgi:muramoyltetrapeptide carboxypeptidase